MKKICPVCEVERARRVCHRHGGAEICSRCCAATRDTACGDCRHFVEAVRQRAAGKAGGTRNVPEFIIELNPEVEEAVNNALGHMEEGRRSLAVKAMTDLSRLYPDDHMVCFGMGTVKAAGGELAESIEWFDRAIAIHPYFTEAYYNKGTACCQTADLAGMVQAYRKVVEYGDRDDPEVRHATEMLAKFSASIMQQDGVSLDQYLQGHGLFQAAMESLEAKAWDRAAEGFSAVIKLNPRNTASHGNLGLCYIHLGRKADALESLDQALKIDPEYQPALVNRKVAERMEEGVCPGLLRSETINYGLEKVLEKRPWWKRFV